ncbi:hypothetical protein GVAV_001471 [Gurleya vavrai]
MNPNQKTFIDANTFADNQTAIFDNRVHSLIKQFDILDDDDFFSMFLKQKSLKNIDKILYTQLKDKLINDKDSLLKNNLLIANIANYLKEYEIANFHINQYKKENKIETNLTGKKANLKYFKNIENCFLALEIFFEHENDIFKENFETDKLRFQDFKIEALPIKIQALLLTELELIINTEKDEKYLHEKIEAYLDRLNYKNNEKHYLIERLIQYYMSFLKQEEYFYLEKVITEKKEIDFDFYLLLPIKFNFEMKERLAFVFYKTFRYESALKIYLELNYTEEIIKCYVGMNKEKEAIENIKENIKLYEKKDNLDTQNKFELFSYYLLLGGLTKNLNYYDKAYEIVPYSEPLRLKGLASFDQKNYQEAALTFEKALDINFNEKILFSYGCSLMKIKNYEKAIVIFQNYLVFDIRSEKAHKNIVACYLEINEIEKALDQLLVAIKYSFNKSLEDFYVALCIKHNFEERAEIYFNKKQKKI